MNIEIAGVKITFGSVSELQEILKRRIVELDKSIQDHEAKALSLRKVRKEMLKAAGGPSDPVKPASAGALGA